MSTESNGPVKTLKDHFIKASIWRNDSKNGPFYGTTIDRTYKDGEDYKTSHTFHGRDLLAGGQLLIQAYHETLELEAADYAAEKPAPAQA